MNLPEKVYTEKDLSRAKTSAKVVGWMQGAGVAIAGGILLNLLGWIPVVIGVAAVSWLLYKMVSRPKEEEAE